MAVIPSDEENKYFRKQEAERRARIREELDAKAAEQREREEIAEELHTDDQLVVARLRALGFDSDTARAFELLPLVHVAWADGSVSDNERRTIMQVAESRGIDQGSEASVLLQALLEERPSDAFLDETMTLLRALTEERVGVGEDIVELCVAVAEASGGFFGFGDKVSDDERDLIARIADDLGGTAVTAFQKRLAEKG